jgi:hypothetical protein
MYILIPDGLVPKFWTCVRDARLMSWWSDSMAAPCTVQRAIRPARRLEKSIFVFVQKTPGGLEKGWNW